MTEDQLQSQCTIWFENTFHAERRMLFHVDNNSWNRVIGAKKKALGVRDGVADLVLILFVEIIFIEMKTLTGVQSDAQKDFEQKVKRRGHKYIIIRTFEKFKEFIYESLGDNQ